MRAPGAQYSGNMTMCNDTYINITINTSTPLTAAPRRAPACCNTNFYISVEIFQSSSNQSKYDWASCSDLTMTKFSTLLVRELRVKLHEPPKYTSPSQSHVFACILAKPPAGGLWTFTTAPHSFSSVTRACCWEQDGFVC